MWGWQYFSWIRPFESSRAFLTLRLYKTPHAGVLTLTLKRPCAGVLTDLKSGREPFALAWHTPKGPISEYFFASHLFQSFLWAHLLRFQTPSCDHLESTGGHEAREATFAPRTPFRPTWTIRHHLCLTRAKLLFYLQSLAKELTESDLTSHEYFRGFEKLRGGRW